MEGVGWALKVRKGAWTKEEDILFKKCIEQHGEGKWHLVPSKAGLNQYRKSCRLRWLNYLNPNIKRGSFAADEIDLIIHLHNLLGNRWSLIAGRLPGRTANDVKNYWNTHLLKQFSSDKLNSKPNLNQSNVVIKPRPWSLTRKAFPILFDAANNNSNSNDDNEAAINNNLLADRVAGFASGYENGEVKYWWEYLLKDNGKEVDRAAHDNKQRKWYCG